MKFRFNLLIGLLGVALLIGYFTLSITGERKPAPVGTGDPPPVVLDENAMGGSFSLVDQDGRDVTEKDYKGKYVLLTFGFTYCPDICPTKLQDMALVADSLGDDAKWLQLLFITIDPERDTRRQMKEYVSLYPNNIQGLTGTPEQIADVAQKFKVYYKRAEDTGGGNYMMDHTAYIYLLDPEGKFLEVFMNETDPAEIARFIRARLHP